MKIFLENIMILDDNENCQPRIRRRLHIASHPCPPWRPRPTHPRSCLLQSLIKYQGSIDLSTVNITCPTGMYFLIHP